MDHLNRATPHLEAIPARIDPLQDRPRFQVHASEAAQQSAASPMCARCGGAGWYKEHVAFNHPHFGVLFPCECRQQERIERVREELLRLSNLAAFRAKTFATFDQFVPGLSKAYLRAVAYAREPRGWLVLFGAYGTGKTHLAAAIAHEALQRGDLVLFVVVPDLLDHLRATYGPESNVDYDERFELVRNVSLLILDDLGTENTTPWAREKLYQLINHRYNEQLATVFTSNLAPDAIDPRIFSRLCDPQLTQEIVRIGAGDYRKRAMQRSQAVTKP